MKKLLTVLLVPFLLMACTTTSVEGPKPNLVMSEIAVIDAQVIAIDYNNRFVTLQPEGGQAVVLHVDESARNFKNIDVGDIVEAEYYESVAVYVQATDGQAPAVAGDQAVGIAPEGSKPGLAMADTQVITADVVSIDYENRTVTLRGPAGVNRRFPVADITEGFENVEVGDQVVIEHTVAVAIAVR